MKYLVEELKIADHIIHKIHHRLMYRGFEHSGIKITNHKSDNLPLRVYRGFEHTGAHDNPLIYRNSNRQTALKVYRGFRYY